MGLVEAFLEILKRPTIGGIILELIMFLGPVWVAFLLGVMVGWVWKPRWANMGNGKLVCSAPSSPSDLNSSSAKDFGSPQKLGSCFTGDWTQCREQTTLPFPGEVDCSSSLQPKKQETLVVTEEDLQHLCHLVERKDGGSPWKHMMDRTTPRMSYQAWQRDPKTGPPQYCSRTVYEDATPELLRDFFWDDEFRLKWDDMLIHAATEEECPTTGTMIVHWIRKFPFFCSNREYIIGRRIWESGRSYYCVTKGVPCSSLPPRAKPRRVDLYYSSWSIRAARSRNGNDELTACEVILFHHEDMGIPWEIAKFGVRQGMWGAVMNIERGLRSYQAVRASGAQLSRPAFMAQINTKIDVHYLETLESDEYSSETQVLCAPERAKGLNIPKLLVFGGAIVIACTLDRGLLTKTLIFGVGRRFANIGRRPCPRT